MAEMAEMTITERLKELRSIWQAVCESNPVIFLDTTKCKAFPNEHFDAIEAHVEGLYKSASKQIDKKEMIIKALIKCMGYTPEFLILDDGTVCIVRKEVNDG